MSAIRRDVRLAGSTDTLMMISSFAAHFYPRCPPGETGTKHSADRERGWGWEELYRNCGDPQREFWPFIERIINTFFASVKRSCCPLIWLLRSLTFRGVLAQRAGGPVLAPGAEKSCFSTPSVGERPLETFSLSIALFACLPQQGSFTWLGLFLSSSQALCSQDWLTTVLYII